MGKKYSTIVFDLGNTLIRFDHNIAVKKLAGLFRLDPKKAYDMFFDSDITRAFETGQISPREFHLRICRALGITQPFDEFVAIWNDIFWADDASCDIVRRLKGYYRLFLLSNVNRLHFEYIEDKFDIIKIFDELILSYMVGAIKPDRIIFEDVVRRAGGDKEGLLYIDDREDLVKEAALFGIDSIRFEGAESLAGALKAKNVI